MSAKVVTLEGFGVELKRIEGQLGDATLRGLRVAAEGLRTEVIRQMGEVKPYQPMDTGDLRKGWKVVHHTDGASVQNLVPYATHMEFGTRPHWAPIGPLRQWAMRKLRGRPDMVKDFIGPRRRRVTKQAVTKARAIERLARKAQHSIARHGTKGRFFWRAALEKLPAIVEKSIDRELKRVR